MLERALGLLGDVDLTFLEALYQVVRREIDKLDRVGAVEDPIGNRLAHAHPGDLRNDVVQALDVLNVDGGIDVDTAVKQLLDVHAALRMPAAGRIGVGELIDQHNLWFPRDDCIDVHLAEPLAAVLDAPARNNLQPVQQRLGFLAAVRLHDPDDDVVAILAPCARGLQHGVGLADAGGGADEDPQLAGTTFLAPGSLEQSFRRGPLVALLICHGPLRAAATPAYRVF